jgi:hypothetical protein
LLLLLLGTTILDTTARIVITLCIEQQPFFEIAVAAKTAALAAKKAKAVPTTESVAEKRIKIAIAKFNVAGVVCR